MKAARLLFMLFIALTSPLNSYSSYCWVQKASIGSSNRYAAMGFDIGGKGYIAGGWINSVGQTDTWEYDPTNDTWTQKASFPGPGRWAGAGFSVNGKGYISVGFTGFSNPTSTYEFDPLANTWTSKAAFPATGRQDVFSFEINNLGFVFGGYGSGTYFNSLYRYNPIADVWNLQSSLPSSGRDGPGGFVIGNTAFICGGYTLGSGALNQVWAYNAINNTWVAKTPFPGSPRHSASGFEMNGKGFFGNGRNNNYLSDFYEYDSTTDSWSPIPNFPGDPLGYALNFSLPTGGYIASGRFNSNTTSNQTWLLSETPTAGFNFSISNCDSIVQFTNTSSDLSVSFWDFGDGSSSTTTSPLHHYSAPGNYTVTLISGTLPCTDTTYQQLTIIASPIASFNYSISNCDSLVEFTNTSNDLSVSFWDFGDGSSSTLAAPSHQYNSPGNYSVTLISGAAPCTDTIRQQITISTPIASQLSLDIDSCSRTVSFEILPTTFLTATWDFGDGSIGSGMNVNHQYPAAGLYNVSAIINQSSGCVDTLSITTDLTGTNTDVFFIPNVFTPNKDLLNDFFEIKGTICNFKNILILDRWGL
ncbi:MAG: PKD domain-containing protein, partial [Bacteroidota bacterium]